MWNVGQFSKADDITFIHACDTFKITNKISNQLAKSCKMVFWEVVGWPTSNNNQAVLHVIEITNAVDLRFCFWGISGLHNKQDTAN